jgi:hypothetical protein
MWYILDFIIYVYACACVYCHWFLMILVTCRVSPSHFVHTFQLLECLDTLLEIIFQMSVHYCQLLALNVFKQWFQSKILSRDFLFCFRNKIDHLGPNEACIVCA